MVHALKACQKERKRVCTKSGAGGAGSGAGMRQPSAKAQNLLLRFGHVQNPRMDFGRK